MPQYIIPHKSGIHRLACLSLYHRLLQRVQCTCLAAELKSSLRKIIRDRFQCEQHSTSHGQVTASLNAGYRALDILNAATSTEEQDARHPLSLIKSLLASRVVDQTKCDREGAQETQMERRGPRVWPTHSAPSVLARPFVKVSGERHVPIYVAACGFPFLRFKKPQSPYLSRLIRDDLKAVQKRVDQMQRLEKERGHAMQEDLWDEHLCLHAGLEKEAGSVLWLDAINDSLRATQRLHGKSWDKRQRYGKMFWDIVVKERELAATEKRDKRHKVREARKGNPDTLREPESIISSKQVVADVD